uniref:Uncharacterized protein n=1 Tax=Arundo donax TaxID=35708 RepID=A0A0A8ZM17_ARUDO
MLKSRIYKIGPSEPRWVSGSGQSNQWARRSNSVMQQLLRRTCGCTITCRRDERR